MDKGRGEGGREGEEEGGNSGNMDVLNKVHTAYGTSGESDY